MSTDAPPSQTVHAGRLIARRLKASGIDTVFTLSGGHLFSIYDGCRSEGIRLIDTRHEQTATFAAEGWSKVTRQPGVAALTAGPGVTNGMSAMAAAQQNSSPLLVLGGRAPAQRWGMGSLQEIDHVPFVAPLTRFAATAPSAEAVSGLVDEALRATVGAPSGVAFIDFPMDHVFSVAADDGRPGALTDLPARTAADGDALDRAAGLLAAARRPVIMAGTNVWWGHAEAALLRLAEQRQIPVLMNGMARGVGGRRPPAGVLAGALQKRWGGRRCARRRSADGLPAGLRRGVRAGNPADRGRPCPTRAGASTADRRRSLRRPVGDPDRRWAETTAAGHDDWVAELRAVETAARDRETSRAGRRPQPAASDAGVRRTGAAAGSRRDHRHRRRRFRLLRRPGHRQLRARALAGQRAVRLPRFGSRLRAGRQTGPAGPAGRACCRATAPSGSAAWSGTRWSGTTCRWSR